MTPIALNGGARARGLGQAQAEPQRAEAVRAAIHMRFAAAEAAGQLGKEARAWLAAAREICARHVPEALEEIEGIAQGYDLAAETVFAYLHLGVLADLAAGMPAAADGCSAWAVAAGLDGPLVVKNRDFRGEHVGLQRLFLHADPAWGDRRMLCLGSLGSPGAYSSGMNSDGLALVDTQIATTDHAPGVLRYFVMTRILSHCAGVPEALEVLASLPHAGGGTIVMADRLGRVAAVELGASRLAIEKNTEFVMRTNHFVSRELERATLAQNGEPMSASSKARLGFLRERIPGRTWSAEAAHMLMGSHHGEGALCRHGEDGDARTISSVVFALASATLYLTDGFACTGTRSRFRLEARAQP